MKLNAFSTSGEAQEVDDTVARFLVIGRLLVVVKNHRGQVHIMRHGEGEVMPLHIAIEIIEARDFRQLASKMPVKEWRVKQAAVLIFHGTPQSKSGCILRKQSSKLLISLVPLNVVFEMESGHYIIEWMAKNVDSLLHQSRTIRHLDFLQSLRRLHRSCS